MDVKQVYTLLNTITTEVLGTANLVNEDLSNVVDIGKQLLTNSDVDNYVRSLVNRIGKTIFVDRKYKGIAPNLLMDSWEFGSVLQKISCVMPDAVENISSELTNGQDYSPNVFYKPTVSSKFYNSKVTFEVNMSFTDRQVKESFDSSDQLNAFYSMLYTSIENSITIKLDSLIMRSISNMIGETLHADYGSAALSGASHIKAVNLLKLYNDLHESSLTLDDCLQTEGFLQFATYTINNYADRLKVMSSLFNVGATAKFTPDDQRVTILLSDFANSCNVFLKSEKLNDSYLALPKGAFTVPFWQGSGVDYALARISAINVKTASGDTIATSGIMGVMFDRNAVCMCNSDKRVTTNYNPRGEFYTNFYKYDCSYINDLSENFVVFFVA